MVTLFALETPRSTKTDPNADSFDYLKDISIEDNGNHSKMHFFRGSNMHAPSRFFFQPLFKQVLLAVDDGERSVLVDLSNVTCPEEALSLDGHPILLGSPTTKKRGFLDCERNRFLYRT
jgi:hypothetical protein